MKKRSWARIFSRITLAIIGIPVIAVTLLALLLYIPPVQRAVVDKACKEIAQRSGYDVEIGGIALTFPLNMQATDFRMSKGDSIYFKGKRFDADISFLPLFTGKVEINYISLEELDIDTHTMLPEFSIDGRIGYARMVARDADLGKSIVDIRQLHIADTDINITLADTTINEESEPLEWIISLHKGSIKNSNIGINIPHDTLSANLYIEELQLRKGCIDIAAMAFAAKEISVDDAALQYDKGNATAQQAPLDHITLENINFNAEELRYATIDDISANITHLTLQQPGGIAINNAAIHFTANKDTLQLHKLEINSHNGSRICAGSTIPQKALENPVNESFTATLLAEVMKADLAGFVTPQIYEKLNIFDRELLNANATLSGNINKISIDTISIELPGIGTMNANGRVKEISAATRNGEIAFNGELYNIHRLIGGNDSIDCRIATNGNIRYDGGIIAAETALHSRDGKIATQCHYSIADTTYAAWIRTEQLSLSDIMPDIPLHSLTMELTAKGSGTDILSGHTSYDAEINIDTLYYAGYRLHDIEAKALQANSVSRIEVEGHDKELLFGIDATTILSHTGIENSTTIKLNNANLQAMGVVDSLLKLSTEIDIAAASDLNETHSLRVSGKSTSITTKQYRFTPESLHLEFATSPKSTDVKLKNGDLNIDGKMDCGYKGLFAAAEKIATMNRDMMSGRRELYHLHDYEEVLPQITLNFNCGERNILHNFLVFNGIETKSIDIDADISQSKGININGYVTKFATAGVGLDSIRFATRQNHDRLDYIIDASDLAIEAGDDEANSQNALLYGSIKCDTITSNFILRDNIRKSDSRAGLTTHITPGNMHIHFAPEAMVFGAPYAFSKNNYINIGKGMSVEADVAFTGGKDNGFHLYTTPDERAAYNINLDIFNIELGEIADALPGLPDVAGKFFAQLNYRQSNDNNVFTCKTNVDNLTYNSNIIGNERIELTYSPRASGAHALRCDISHNGTTVAGIGGGMLNDRFKGNISITRLPLSITQAFIDKEGVILNGYLNGKMDFSGKLTNMKSQGYLQLDSTYAYSPMLGATLHPSNERIMIENSRINLQEYHIYDNANTPFVMNGNVDIGNLLNPKLSLRLNATDYEVLNTPQGVGKSIYGKMYVNLRSMIRGTLNDIRVMGDLTILSKSNVAYLIPESAFETSKELDGLVEFVNFNDTTLIRQQEQTNIDLGNITANLNIKVEEGAKLSLDLDAARENYITFDGDGNLNATYDTENGMNVTGLYKLNGGQLKLTLPIIPLKTFYIQEGGRITWTGDMFNPALDITALEKTTVSVEFEDNSIQPVVFNTSVVIGNNVNDMSIGFTMSSPENSIIQNQLNALDPETLSRYAVAMIITGTYLGGRQGVTAASALSSFLDAKINEISGSAIKNFDVNIGINDALNAETGNAYKNYSFSFSKRFFNDRITVVIGGEVNSGDRPDKSAGNETFINNVSLEWKLNNSGNRYIRIFYDKNYQSLLEGEITETGVGYVYKRKLNKLKELFTFKRKKKKEDKEQPDNTENTRARK